MKQSIIILFILNLSIIKSCYGQDSSHSINDTLLLYNTPAISGNYYTINNSQYARVLDGILLEKGQSTPDDIEIISTWKLGDTSILKKLGLKNSVEPYIFMNSAVTSFHKYVYKRFKQNKNFEGINLPILLNNELITPAKYYTLEKIDTNSISKIEFLRKESKLIEHKNLLLGAIKVTIPKKT